MQDTFLLIWTEICWFDTNLLTEKCPYQRDRINRTVGFSSSDLGYETISKQTFDIGRTYYNNQSYG